MMTIQENIRKFRLQKHLSQEELGSRLGISGQAVSKWEQGITSPDTSLLPLLAECFGVTIDSLFGDVAARRYPGYGGERNELVAFYMDENGTEADFMRAAEALGEVILNGRAEAEDYLNYDAFTRYTMQTAIICVCGYKLFQDRYERIYGFFCFRGIRFVFSER